MVQLFRLVMPSLHVPAAPLFLNPQAWLPLLLLSADPRSEASPECKKANPFEAALATIAAAGLVCAAQHTPMLTLDVKYRVRGAAKAAAQVKSRHIRREEDFAFVAPALVGSVWIVCMLPLSLSPAWLNFVVCSRKHAFTNHIYVYFALKAAFATSAKSRGYSPSDGRK